MNAHMLTYFVDMNIAPTKSCACMLFAREVSGLLFLLLLYTWCSFILCMLKLFHLSLHRWQDFFRHLQKVIIYKWTKCCNCIHIWEVNVIADINRWPGWRGLPGLVASDPLKILAIQGISTAPNCSRQAEKSKSYHYLWGCWEKDPKMYILDTKRTKHHMFSSFF